MAMTPLTGLDRTSPTFKTELDTFFLTNLPQFVTEANALETAVEADKTAAAGSAVDAAGSAVAADASADAAALSEANALSSANAAAMVASPFTSGQTVAVGDVRYSPVDMLTYRAKTAGVRTTDPSADATNWARISGNLVGADLKTVGGVSLVGAGNIPFPDTSITPIAFSTAVLFVAAGGSFTVPNGVTSIRAYAFGAGSMATSGYYGGGGGSCSWGTIPVVAGDVFSFNGTQFKKGATNYLTVNPASSGTGGSAGTVGSGLGIADSGTAAGGTATGFGGASSGSPLGVGWSGGGGWPYSSGGGWGGVGGGGGGGGVGSASLNGGSGGAGPARAGGQFGGGRSFDTAFTDPLLRGCTASGAAAVTWGTSPNINYLAGHNGGPGAGGGSVNGNGQAQTTFGGDGGFGGGGGCAYNGGSNVYGGDGGFGGGGGGGGGGTYGGHGGKGGVGGGGGMSQSVYPQGAGGPSGVLIYY